MTQWLSHPWPWYVAGPLIGLFVPALLLAGNKSFGVSSNLRHLCAAFCATVAPGRVAFFDYDWKGAGLWNLTFLAGILVGGFVGAWLTPEPLRIAAQTQADLMAIGVADFSGLAPRDAFTWPALLTLKGIVSVVVGGFLVGFGTAYAGGCTSGHAISGLADLQLPSLVAVIRFFAGGLLATYVLLPIVY